MPYAEALSRPDGHQLANIALGNDCKENWLLSKMATEVTKMVKHGIESIDMPVVPHPGVGAKSGMAKVANRPL